MSSDNNVPPPSFFSRVIGNETTRKGVASAVAAVLVSCLTEALWPSP